MQIKLENLSEEDKKIYDELVEKSNKPKEMFERADIGEYYYLIDNHFDACNSQEDGYCVDTTRFKSGNYFTSEALAEKAAEHLKQNFWFIRKAIEFADGYEFADGHKNYSVFWANDDWIMNFGTSCREPADIYMAKEGAEKFVEWLNIHKPDGV